MGVNFNSNNYGITKQEWKSFKKEMKAADKANDNYELSRSDYKEMKVAIKNGDLGAYLDKASDDLKLAMGLSLTGKVDGTEDLAQATNLVNVTDIKNADKAKVIDYIKRANFNRMEKGMATVTEDITNVYDPAMKQAVIAHIETSSESSPYAKLFA